MKRDYSVWVYSRVLKRLNLEVPYDLRWSPLGIFPQELRASHTSATHTPFGSTVCDSFTLEIAQRPVSQ